MKPAPFTYYDPHTIDEALDLLGRFEDVRMLAGGQSLMPMMNFRFVQPEHLIDLNNVASLAGISREKDALRLGAMTRQREIEFSPEVRKFCPVLWDALVHVGHRQTRNRGTIGGSLCHLDPTAELVNCIRLHDGAQIHLRGNSGGPRDVTFDEFASGFMTPAISDDEMVVGVTLPLWSDRHGSAFVEVARRKGDFAITAVGALIDLDDRGAIARAAISVAGVTPNPVRAAEAEQVLVGERPEADAFRAAAESLEFRDPMADAYVTAEYRLHLAGVLTHRALEMAARRAEEKCNV